MGLEGRLVLVHVIEPDAVGVIGILNDVEPRTSGLVAHRVLRILGDGGDELVLEPWFDLDGSDDDVYKCLLDWSLC
jgi:hypothetical protein